MTESFAQLFEESVSKSRYQPGQLIIGEVISIDDESVIVYAGLKSEGVIPAAEFRDPGGVLTIKVGDRVEVVIESLADLNGETRLSREKAQRVKAWDDLEKAHEAQSIVTGVLTGKVKGGFTVAIAGVRAFLPSSLVDVRPVRDPSYLEGKELEFKVIKIDKKRSNVVVSRRAVVEKEMSAERQTFLNNLEEGQTVKGIVKNLTDYGAFIDLGGIDGLLHITDMAWKRIKHPSEMLKVGDEIEARVLRFERDRSRVSLGIKQLGDDPWVDIQRRYPERTRLFGKITNITDYGSFVEIEPGVEGLVHVSEMDWTNKNIHPSKVVQLGDEVEVMILDIDLERRRISLGMKQCKPNPWEEFAANHQKGEKIAGKIKSITDFGIFVGLEGGIDGLIHLSDLSWNRPGEEAVRDFKKGDEVEATILAVDPERERISLGLKQMDGDPFANYVGANGKGTIVKGIVTAVEAKGATIKLADDIEGYLRASELSRDRIEDARSLLKEGDEVEAKITAIDRKTRKISLSVKAKDMQEETEAVQEYSRKGSAGSGTTLGDLLKDKLGSTDTENP
ncbi:MAG: 30S ribosomal protein S1 [Candidatus Muproteobacteria bacterium RBG_16_62_13]|uniref:Small ribosomal subunit protein bS1 n=1 Tax=Candidatus Muproteobacteria bacterium RBG_16_62_13 TaxID=1817756 RepID=A0A1F6T7N9_9PROT|nr:MAG: 30S ribosomal protein S1 [Candidatus Muproteobacteria bacterium RBG_16_62_13]